MRASRLAAMAALAGLASLMAGCGDEGPSHEQDAEGRYVVRMAAAAYEPRELRVPVGATVVWVNDLDVPHNVEGFEENTASFFNSEAETGGPMTRAGDSWDRTFWQDGTWRIHCHYHHAQLMSQTIIVGDGEP